MPPEFAHGGNRPIFVLTNPAAYPNGCAVNPANGGVAFNQMAYCAYDGDGDLFADGATNETRFVFAELAKGAKSLKSIALNQCRHLSVRKQWQPRETNGSVATTP